MTCQPENGSSQICFLVVVRFVLHLFGPKDLRVNLSTLEEEGLSDKIAFINKNSLDNGLPEPCLKKFICAIPSHKKTIPNACLISV